MNESWRMNEIEWFNLKKSEGDNNMGMDEYEQQNLKKILDELNQTKQENERLKKHLQTSQKILEDMPVPSITDIIAERMAKECAEVQFTVRFKSYFDETN